MDIQGVNQIEALVPRENVVTVYIDAGGWDTLARRILGRAPVSAEELESRRLRYEYEKEFKSEADYIVENFDGRFKEADAAFEAIIRKLLPSA
jgi:guanylate kinase